MTKDKIHIYVMWLAAFVIAACSDTVLEEESQEMVPMTIEAQPEATRTALEGTSVVWSKGDEVAVYDFISPKHLFTSETTEGRTRFLGQITAKTESFAAIYPYDLAGETSSSQSALPATLPTEQYAVANGFPAGMNISVAKGTRNIDGSPSYVTFHNVCQLLRFTIPTYVADKVTSIVFTAQTAVAGKLNIDYSGTSPVVSIAQTESKAITVLPPSRTSTFAAGTYYILTAPVQLNGFSMTMQTSDDKSYRLASSTQFGGDAGRIYSLGSIDLVNTPEIKINHVYENGLLQGTKVSAIDAPIEGQPWTITIKNAKGTTVRTLLGTGNLTSDETDASWPYLPTGIYSASYAYTTSNGKTITKTISDISVSDKPTFGMTFTAYTSYSYYKGDGVAKNIVTANSLDPKTIYNPTVTITGVAERILTNSNYNFSVSNNFEGSLSSSSNGVYNYQSYSVDKYQEYKLSDTVAFDGVSHTVNRSLHITGLPYKAVPPTQSDWTGDAYDWNGEEGGRKFVRLHYVVSFSSDPHVISKSFYAPEDLNVSVAHNVYVRSVTVRTTYILTCSGTELKSINPERYDRIEDSESYNGVLTSSNPIISCSNSYGNPPTVVTGEGTHTKVYSVAVNYRDY